MSMSVLLARYARDGIAVQIRLRHDLAANGSPLGPGLLRPCAVTDDGALTFSGTDADLFTFDMPVMVGDNSGRKAPQELILPITFAAADVLWVSTGPVEPRLPQVFTRQSGLHLP